MRVILGVSGASGAILAVECARALAVLDVEIDLVISAMAERTLTTEVGGGEALRALVSREHRVGDLGAAIASGSCQTEGMIVAPCSMRSLAAIAHGLDDGLLTRAAGVQLIERRRLVLVTREAPLTLAHLRNMVAATEMGAIILPPVPAFYLRPQSVAEVAAQIAARAVDLLRLGPPLAPAWDPT